MKNTMNKKVIILASLAFIVGNLGASVKKVSSMRSWRDRLVKDLLVVAYFNKENPDTKGMSSADRKSVKAAHRDRKDLFKQISKVRDFKKAKVVFVNVNLGKKGVQPLELRYELVGKNYIILLFQDGSPVRGKDGKPVKLERPKDMATIRAFVERHLGEHIDAELADQAERARERAKNRNLYSPYVYGGYGWGWPSSGFYSSPYYSRWGHGYGHFGF
jgi:hypothetical protein